jgi:prepilin-type processing-associated H-X9-DG protein
VYVYSGVTYQGVSGTTNIAYVDGSVRTVLYRADLLVPSFQGSDFCFVDPTHPTPKW